MEICLPFSNVKHLKLNEKIREKSMKIPWIFFGLDGQQFYQYKKIKKVWKWATKNLSFVEASKNWQIGSF